MSDKRIGRNDCCPCGSGKKYKKCCLSKSNDDLLRDKNVEKEIEKLAIDSLEFNEKTILNSINRLKAICNSDTISFEQKQNALMSLAQSYQKYGDHSSTLEILKLIEIDSTESEAFLNNLAAISYNALGYHKESAEIFNSVIDKIDSLKLDDKCKAGVYLEAGKTFKCNNEELKAVAVWEKAAELYSKYEDQKNHYARVKSNIAFTLLKNIDEQEQEKGINIIEELSEIKKIYGDIEGLANNYCNLAIYYWEKKRYQKAISCMRHDLMLSRKAGNQQNLATSLMNLGTLYLELKQLTPAKSLFKEAKKIGETFNDNKIIINANNGIENANDIGKAANLSEEKIGPKAICLCGSGKEYQECCGMADFEPVELPMHFGGISKDLEELHYEFEKEGIESSQLDFILRDTNESDTRLSWSQMKGHDGWIEVSELPDMCNHHLISAQILAEESEKDPDAITKPLSCVILAACSLEAFINQVSFFLYETQKLYEGKYQSVPDELKNGAFEFQRNTELTLKWDLVGKALCGEFWPPSASLWSDFKNLIFIRNELVHFKIVDYETVIPPPKRQHEIIRRMSSCIEIREIPRAWPGRVLTPSLAKWSVNTSKSMIKYLKSSYKKNRLNVKK